MAARRPGQRSGRSPQPLPGGRQRRLGRGGRRAGDGRDEGVGCSRTEGPRELDGESGARAGTVKVRAALARCPGEQPRVSSASRGGWRRQPARGAAGGAVEVLKKILAKRDGSNTATFMPGPRNAVLVLACGPNLKSMRSGAAGLHPPPPAGSGRRPWARGKGGARRGPWGPPLVAHPQGASDALLAEETLGALGPATPSADLPRRRGWPPSAVSRSFSALALLRDSERRVTVPTRATPAAAGATVGGGLRPWPPAPEEETPTGPWDGGRIAKLNKNPD